MSNLKTVIGHSQTRVTEIFARKALVGNEARRFLTIIESTSIFGNLRSKNVRILVRNQKNLKNRNRKFEIPLECENMFWLTKMVSIRSILIH